MVETISGFWRVWTGTKQEVLDAISDNEELMSIRSLSANTTADTMTAVVRFI